MRSLILIICTACSLNLHANNYYFSSSSGDDSYTNQQAQDSTTPWKTLNKLNAFIGYLQPGDSVLFKRGNIFYGNISITSGNNLNVSFGVYSNGENPVIAGFTSITNWTNYNGNIMESPCNACTAELNVLLMNNKEKAKGRTPNTDQPHGGYLLIKSAIGNTSITSSALQQYPDFTGGQVVIRKARWVLDRNTILQQTGNTISYQSESGYGASQGYGFFIQDNINTLDEAGEWYFDKAQKNLLVDFGSSTANSINIQVSTVDTLVYISNTSNISFNNLNFQGANKNTFQLDNANNITINHCNISYSGINAINSSNTSDFVISNSTIAYTNNIAINGYYNNASFTNNTIQNTSMLAGMGAGDSGSYEAFLLNGSNNVISGNTIDSVGYIPVTFSGDSNIIQNNVIKNFTLVKDDGGGIYNWNNSSNAAEHYGNIIRSNIILNGKGAPYGTDNYTYLPSNGIYIDDNAGNILIENNTIAYCRQHGIFIHNAHNNVIQNNTSYNNAAPFAMIHDNIAADKPVTNNIIKSNIFFSTNVMQPAALYQTINNDINNFGLFDSNYYCRPFKPDLTISTSHNNGTTQLLNLNDWETIYNTDKSSKAAPVSFPYYTISSLSANKLQNGNFNTNINGLYCYSAQNNCVTSWNNNNALDSGALQVTFSSYTSNSNYASLIIGIDSLKANERYIVRFSTAGFIQYSTPQVYFRQSQSSYDDLSDRIFVSASTPRKNAELMLTSKKDESNASLIFDMSDQAQPIYFDNIQVTGGHILKTNPNSYISFLYNDSPYDKTFNLSRASLDVTGKAYQNSITLKPFTSIILMLQSNTTGIAYKSQKHQ